MNAVERIQKSALYSFLGRCAGSVRDRVHVLQNPTEDIVEELHNGPKGKTKLFFAGAVGARARLEENYLFDTRRFPSFVTGETFAANLLSGDYIYFMNAQGSPAANNGFSPVAVPVMSDVETNMDTPGQVPQGKNFVMTQVGVSFNSDIVTADAATLLEAGAIRFAKQGGQFTIRHGTPKMWGGGMGIMTSLATASPATNGNPDIRAVRKLAVPRVLGQRDQFSYTYIVPRITRNTLGAITQMTLSAPCIMTIWLWGGQEDSIPT
jgi:hypothetical protein